MRPSYAFAAALVATGLIAAAVPAYADTPPAPPGVAPVTQQLNPQPTPSASPTSPPSSSTPGSTRVLPNAVPTAASTSVPAALHSGNPLTDLTSCLHSAGGDPTAYRTCLTDAGKAISGGGPQAAAVQVFLACVQKALTDKSTAEADTCATALFTALAIPGATCLDPTLQPILTALDSLLGGDPSKLQAALTSLPTTLPGQLAALSSCLNPTATTPAPAAATTDVNAPAAGDLTAAVPVSATPNFTG